MHAIDNELNRDGQIRVHPNSTPSRDLAAALIDQVECGLIACDVDGWLLHANRAARRELAEGRVLRLAKGQLRCDIQAAELTEALHDAAVRHRRRLLGLGQGKDQLTLVTMPAGVDAGQTPSALIVLGRRTVCSTLGLEMLALRQGLTLAEQRVLRSLVANRPVREIAAEHGVALSTVRTQIQAIREKVGVRSIDALLLNAAQLPPVASSVMS